MRIVVLVKVNIKCVTLRYEYMFEIYCRSFEQKRDVIRIRLKRTIWAASGEPEFLEVRIIFSLIFWRDLVESYFSGAGRN